MGEKRVVLGIIGGFGLSDEIDRNACSDRYAPSIWNYLQSRSFSRLNTTGEAVGLPPDVIGSAEVSLFTMGAGRILPHPVCTLNEAIQHGEFVNNSVLQDQFDYIRENHSAWHIVGLLSPGKVHSRFEHLVALLKSASLHNIENVYIHGILDGWDALPGEGITLVRTLIRTLDEFGAGEIVSLIGRRYAMDRNNRWNLTEQAYRLLVHGEGTVATDPVAAIKNQYENGWGDYNFPPVTVPDPGGSIHTIHPGDALFTFNFRDDRMRQLLRAFVYSRFAPFDTVDLDLHIASMTPYDDDFDIPTLFSARKATQSLGEVIAGAGKQQVRISETETSGHISRFLNCGREDPFPGEDRIMIPSPRESDRHMQPGVNVRELTGGVIDAIQGGWYQLIVFYIPAPDLLGHTGDMNLAGQAVRAVDTEIQRLITEAHRNQVTVCLTSDHGNAECMRTEDNSPHTTHTYNPVPFLLVNPAGPHRIRPEGSLQDIAPTLLQLLGCEIPAEMTGNSLLN